MSVAVMPHTLGSVNIGGDDGEVLGKRLKARRIKLGMTASGLAAKAGIDRGRLAAVENGDPTVRASTVGAIESALERLEHEMGMDQSEVQGDETMVEFRVAGNFGVDVVVKGPVRDMEALEESVSRLVEKMQRERE